MENLDSSCVLCTLLVIVILYISVQIFRLLVADCDLSLQWATRLGRGIGRLRGKVVWITGASSGIGEHLSYELAAAGCRLVLSARRKDELERVKKQCQVSGPLKPEDILVLPLDVLKYNTHSDATETVLKYFGQIDVLVNNAGRTQRAVWEETDLEVDRDMLDLNVLGVLSLTKAVLPHMINTSGGHVVVMSSVAGKVGVPMSGSYCGAKFALHGWFDSLRSEGYEKNIKVTLLCPGPVFSGILKAAMTSKHGENYGIDMKSDEKRMSTRRCAYLSAVAIANELDEVWIALHPVLGLTYLHQYMPAISKWLMKGFGMKKIKELREGR
ncbi:dehydrogenase/reductase SDR family member 7-like [Liolophura sinensis]|uniref:dehydrogenase/reductase SDR family member 7-like n=1 Tax=Liolophura sinensis TaxID=3198878 RepID=UPI003158F823